MADDTPKSGQKKRILERFEVFETHPTAHLTEEQKKWKIVKLRPAREHNKTSEQQPAFVLKLYLKDNPADSNRLVLAENIYDLVQVISKADRELGGSGLFLSNQRDEPDAVILTLSHTKPEGAAERSRKLASMLGDAEQNGIILKLLSGFLSASRCEVLGAAV